MTYVTISVIINNKTKMFEREAWTYEPELRQRKVIVRDEDAEYDLFVETNGEQYDTFE